jgi:hypothetical protein
VKFTGYSRKKMKTSAVYSIHLNQNVYISNNKAYICDGHLSNTVSIAGVDAFLDLLANIAS